MKRHGLQGLHGGHKFIFFASWWLCEKYKRAEMAEMVEMAECVKDRVSRKEINR